MNRRNFLASLGAGAAAGAAVAQEVAQRVESTDVHPALRYINPKTGGHPFTAQPPGKRPPIFFITLDMVSPEHYHPSRKLSREVNLPAIQSLKSDGAFFTNSFCTAPLCAPARAALATGRCSDRYDELYDLASDDAVNLAAQPAFKKVHSEMTARLGAFLEKDPGWRGYYSSFSVDHHGDLPRPKGDVQMFRPV